VILFAKISSNLNIQLKIQKISTIPLLIMKIIKKIGQKKKIKIDEKLVIKAISIMKKNENKDKVISLSDNLSDIFQENKLGFLLKNLVNHNKKLKNLTVGISNISFI